MFKTVEMPLWLLILILLFAAVTFASHFLFPSVRWFFRRRLERAVKRLNKRLAVPIQPFKLARRYDMIQRVIYDPQVSQAIAGHAKETGDPENVAFQRARRYAREIVPAFSAFAYFGFAIRLARFLGNAFYRVRLAHQGTANLRTIDPDDTVVFVMNHRSNMDYVLVTYLAAQESALSYAVGEWARVWPLSRLIRAVGAYFIRRKSRNELYRRVLSCYVKQATAAGVTQAMFPEGGLSMSGELMPPKMGLLKYITDGFDGTGRDVIFVPVALNYDRVLEDKILIAAEKDPKHRFKARIGVVAAHTLKLVWLKIIGRYHRFGYAAVSYGSPISLREFQKTHGGDLTERLSQELIREIGQIVPVLPVPLISWLIQTRGPQTRQELEAGFAEIIEGLPNAYLHLPRNTPDKGVDHGLVQLAKRAVLIQQDGRYAPNPAQQDILRYYANSIGHLMPPSSDLPHSAAAK